MLANICECCIRSPVIDPGPTITTSTEAFTISPCSADPCAGSFTSSGITVTSLPVDSIDCIYSIQVSCIDPTMTIITINMNPTLQVASPTTFYDGTQIGSSSETLTCENPPGLYMFNDPPTYSGTVGNVECECPPNACLNSFTVLDADITVSAPMILFDCIYYIDVSCADPADFVEINQATDNRQELNPTSFTCDQTAMKYVINGINVDTLECRCGDNPCPAFTTGPGVDLTTPTADGSCVYTLEATCTNPAFFLIFNMDISTGTQGPETITCTSGSYQYNGGSGPTDVNNLECGCRQVNCFDPTTQPGVDLTAPVSDNNCVFTRTASCTLPAQMLIFNFPGTSASSPQTLTCSPGNFNYQNPAAGGTVGSIQCQCAENSCSFSYIVFGPDIDVMESGAGDDCNYPIVVSCTDPTYEIVININEIRAPNPSTFTCDSTVMKYTQNTVSINRFQCEPACTNPCGTLSAGNGMTLTAPAADGSCVYTFTATCDTGTMIEIALMGGPDILATSPQTFTCTTGPSWLYDNGAGTDPVSGLLQCV